LHHYLLSSINFLEISEIFPAPWINRTSFFLEIEEFINSKACLLELANNRFLRPLSLRLSSSAEELIPSIGFSPAEYIS
jgi:hypothetical protein